MVVTVGFTGVEPFGPYGWLFTGSGAGEILTAELLLDAHERSAVPPGAIVSGLAPACIGPATGVTPTTKVARAEPKVLLATRTYFVLTDGVWEELVPVCIAPLSVTVIALLVDQLSDAV